MSVVGERRGAAKHADIAALVDDLALLARLGDLHFGTAAVLGEAAGQRDGFLLRPVLGDERPLGLAVEVDPPLVASFYLNDNTIHEVRGTLRYRFQ